jgi:ribonuclease P protein component
LLHLVAYRTDREDTRIGFSVSTRVGGAVVRNRIKRRLRMIIRAIPWHPGFDVVFLVQPSGASVSFHELEATIVKLAARMDLTAGVNE